MQTKKLLVSTLILATLGGTFLQVSPVFAVNRSTYSQGSTNDKKYGMGAYAHQYGNNTINAHANLQAYAWLNTYWGQRVNFYHGNGYIPGKLWG